MTQEQIPSHLIFEGSITKNIEGHQFDFLIKYTIYGEMLDIKCPVFELPKEAQVLTVGPNYKAVNSKVLSWMALYKFKLALCYKEALENDSLKPLLNVIDEKAKENNFLKRTIDLKYVQDDWVQKYYEITSHAIQSNDRKLKKCLKKFPELFKEEESASLWQQFMELAKYNFEPAGSVIRFLVPFLKEKNNINHAYQSLAVFPSDENKAFLKAACVKNANQKLINNILKGFSEYKDEDIVDFLGDIYHKDSALGPFGKQNILKALSNIKNETTERILVAELLGTGLYSANDAFQYLRAWDYSEKDLADLINSVFYDPERKEHLESLLTVYKNIQNPALLPSVDAVYQVVKDVLNMKPQASLSHAAAHVFIKLYDDSVPELLYKLLEHENGEIRKNSLVIINRLYFTKDHLIDFEMNDKIIEKIMELTKRKDRNVGGWGAQVLTEVYLKTKNHKILDLLCSCLDREDLNFASSLLYYLNKIFRTVGFKESALAIYFDLLDTDDQGIRKAVLEGLQYSDLQAVKDKFLALANDNNSEISRFVRSVRLPRHLVKYPEYTRSELMERALERKEFLAFNKLR